MTHPLPIGTIVYIKSETFTVLKSYKSYYIDIDYIYTLESPGGSFTFVPSSFITGYKLQEGRVIKIV